MPNDIAFKVIIKNDGISDIIFKTLMLKGEAGGTISSIEKTSSSGNVDTYTITLNDGTTTTFEVTNGSNIASIEKTATAGLIDTYTVTLTNGDTSTFEVKNGEDAQLYELPQNCVVGYDGGSGETTHQEALSNTITIEEPQGFQSIKVSGYTSQKHLTGKNKMPEGQWVNAYIRDDGVFLVRTTGGNDVACEEYAHIDSSQPCIITVNNWTDIIPSWMSIFGYDSNKNFISGSKITVQRLGNLPLNLQVVYENTLQASYIRFYFHGSGSYAQYIPDDVQVEIGNTASSYEEYCGGTPAPNANYPQEIEGLGELSSGSYVFDTDVVNSELNTYTLTASMSSPCYDGDVIDLLNDKIYRNNVIDIPSFSNAEGWSNVSGTTDWYFEPADLASSDASAYCTHFLCEIQNNTKVVIKDTGCSSLSDLATLQTQQTNLGKPITIVYSKLTESEEATTITGDVSNVKIMRDNEVVITAPENVPKIQADYFLDSPFPDGYEEIDFPLDDLFYYQNGEYIDFPSSWGFVMGYVFDADEIRFVMNVTKALKEGMTVNITRSADLTLNTYAGAGDVGILSGFSANYADFIPELGQIQIRLQTAQPHGLTTGMLLGARVATGVLRIIFEEET